MFKSAFFLFGASVLLLTSCKKDDHDHDHDDEEVITTMRLTFTPVGSTNAVTFQYDDPDGPGGANPTQDQITLAPNTVYNVSLQLLNKTKNPVADVTTEVQAEGQAHRFYYQVANGSNITVSDLNTDAAGLPLGITSRWTTTTATNSGNVRVILRHYGGNPPNKAANDPADSPKSSTDIDVNFATRVQ